MSQLIIESYKQPNRVTKGLVSMMTMVNGDRVTRTIVSCLSECGGKHIVDAYKTNTNRLNFLNLSGKTSQISGTS